MNPNNIGISSAKLNNFIERTNQGLRNFFRHSQSSAGPILSGVHPNSNFTFASVNGSHSNAANVSIPPSSNNQPITGGQHPVEQRTFSAAQMASHHDQNIASSLSRPMPASFSRGPMTSSSNEMNHPIGNRGQLSHTFAPNVNKPLPALPKEARASTFNKMQNMMQRQKENIVMRTNIERSKKETVFDLVKLANSKPESQSILLGQVKGEYPTKKKMQQILENTIKEYNLPRDSKAGKALEEFKKIKNPFFQISPQQLQAIVKDVGEEIHKNQHVLNPQLSKVSHAPREAARMPTECMMQWIATVDNAAKNASDPVQKWNLEEMLNEAKSQWLQHKLSFKDTREFFSKVETECGYNNLPDLSQLAGKLKSEIPGPEYDRFNSLQFDPADNTHKKNAKDDEVKTRLHDNVYGRVYDSAFIESLVKKPPEGVKDSMNKVGNLVADWFEIPNNLPPDQEAKCRRMRNKHLDKLQDEIKKDHRGWENQSPLLKAFVDETDHDKKAVALNALLRTPKQTGIDCIVIPYVAVKATITDPWPAQQWKVIGDQNYATVIGIQAKRVDNKNNAINEINQRGILELQNMQANKDAILHNIDTNNMNRLNAMVAQGFPQAEVNTENARLWHDRQNTLAQLNNDINVRQRQIQAENQPIIAEAAKMAKNTTVKTADAGITMLHQPAAVKEGWMEAHLRPSTNYKPDFENSNFKETGLSSATGTALSNGLVFAGGVSGSTNIMLHLINDANKNHGAGIDMKDALLGTTMFLTFDGGHSIHEPLWVANQLDEKLGLGLQLGDSSKPNEFVSDYSKLFKGSYDPYTGENPIKAASDEAFNKTTAYFKENSFYSETNTQKTK